MEADISITVTWLSGTERGAGSPAYPLQHTSGKALLVQREACLPLPWHAILSWAWPPLLSRSCSMSRARARLPTYLRFGLPVLEGELDVFVYPLPLLLHPDRDGADRYSRNSGADESRTPGAVGHVDSR
ncbi:hypothetical protein MAPG_06155 [Magnaporthiopsis poae ATCC 64411]|uniref:Uncharacterized protein n=1 Tax=Magnaporthiopsis poae (strain ATCC 64411 / 73-15) TaxID=644358 RepID=A0A0C4E1A1_MAGP6|nr:hypothetical protein MAPG_06155 [Magnaporthiopsis poae ATCC 64411]